MNTAIVAGRSPPKRTFITIRVIEIVGIGHVADPVTRGGDVFTDAPVPLLTSRPAFDGISEYIGERFIQGTAFIGINQSCRIGCNRVRDFMSAYIKCGKRYLEGRRSASIAIRHNRAVPKRIGIVGTVMHIAAYFSVVVVKAVSVEQYLEEIKGFFCPPMGIGSHLVPVGVGVVPEVVRISEINGCAVIRSFAHVEGFHATTSAGFAQSV